MRRTLPHLLLALLVSGCNLVGLDGRCGPESREVLSSIAPTPLVRYGQFSIVERDEDPERTLGWLLYSEALLGRIRSAALVERETGERLITLPVMAGPEGIALQDAPPFEFTGPGSFDRLFGLTREERVSLLLETTLPEAPRVELPLLLYDYKPWGQAYCS